MQDTSSTEISGIDMGDPGENSPSREDGTLQKTAHRYRLPTRFLYFDMILFSLMATLTIFAWVPALISFFTYGTVIASALRAAVFLNFTAAVILLSFFFIKRELRRVEFLLSDSALARHASTGTVSIPFSGIRSVTSFRMPLCTGFATIQGDRGILRIPLSVVNGRDLFQRLEAACAASASGIAASEKTAWGNILRGCAFSEAAGRRASAVFSPVLSLCVAMLPVNVLVGAFFWDMGVVPLMFWGITGPLFPMIAYAGADIFIRMREVSAGSGDGETFAAETAVEPRVYSWSAIAGLLLYLAAGIVYRAMVR